MSPGLESSSNGSAENVESTSVESTIESSSEVSDGIKATDFENVEIDSFENTEKQTVDGTENIEAENFEIPEKETEVKDSVDDKDSSVKEIDFEADEVKEETPNKTSEMKIDTVENVEPTDFSSKVEYEQTEDINGKVEIENVDHEVHDIHDVNKDEAINFEEHESGDRKQPSLDESSKHESSNNVTEIDFEKDQEKVPGEENSEVANKETNGEVFVELDQETSSEVVSDEKDLAGKEGKNDDFNHWINPENYDENGKYTGEYKPDGMDASEYVQKAENEGKQNYAEYLQRRTDISWQEKNELYADYISKMENDGKDVERLEVTDIEDHKDIIEEKSPMMKLGDYMSKHNYGPQNFAEYSQDPEWRELQKEAFPDYELPPLDNAEEAGEIKENVEVITSPAESYERYEELQEQQELIYQKLEEPKEAYINADDIFEISYVDDNPNFWNEKTYTKEQYIQAASKISEVKELLDEGKSIEELRENEDLRDCINAYYSENHPIEVMKYDNVYIYQSDGRHRIMAAKEVGCEIPVKITYEAKEKAVVKEEILKDFEKMGIDYEGIDDISIERSMEIKDAIDEMQKEYPEIKDLLSQVEITDELEDGTFASAGPRVVENQFTSKIFINKKEFNEDLESKLSVYKEKGYFAGEGNKAIIKHEAGHILQLKLDAESADLYSGDYITGEINRKKYNDMIDKWNSNEHTDRILDNALRNLSLSRKDVSAELSRYGSTNSAEALAEAVSEVNTSSHPRRLALEIVKEYEKLKKEMEGMKC